MQTQTRPAPRLLSRTALTLLVAAVLSAAGPARATFTHGPLDASPADNLVLAGLQGGLIGAHDAGVVLGLVPFYPVSVIGEFIALETNIGLKFVPPILIPPSALELRPVGDACTYDFFLPQTRDIYDNWFGFWDIDPVATNWGVLGAPTVRHANTTVEVSVGPADPLQLSLERGFVSLREGTHTLEWIAVNRISPVFDIVVPPVLMLAGALAEVKYGTAVAAKAAGKGAKEASKLKLAVAETLGAVSFEAGVDLIDYGLTSVLQTVPVSTNNRATQTVTVLDTHTPFLRRNPAVPDEPLEARDLGGLRLIRAEETLRERLVWGDDCQKPVTLTNDAPPVLPVGTTFVRWTAADVGDYAPGVAPTASLVQVVEVEDTQPPLLMPPAGFVRELPFGVDSLPLTTADLGLPMAIDLADPEPTLVWTAPSEVPVDTRLPVTWTATDASGNADSKLQWVTVKREGTNTTPVARPAEAATVTSAPVDVRLEGVDLDVLRTTLPGGDEVDMVDALAFEIVEPPAHGEFVAPLRPVFIEDFRLTPIGETEQDGVRTTPVGNLHGPDFQATPPAQHHQWLTTVGCPAFGVEWPVDMVYEPTYVHVTDDGTYYVRDHYWDCSGDNLPGQGPAKVARISRWSPEREFLGHHRLFNTVAAFDDGNHSNFFSVDRAGGLWWTASHLAFGGTTLSVQHVDASFENPRDSQQYGISEQDRLNHGLALTHAHADPERGLLYIHTGRGVEVHDLASRERLGALTIDGEERFLPQYTGSFPTAVCGDPPAGGSIRAWMDTDSRGTLYVSSACGNRIFQFEPSGLSLRGDFEPGAFVGWMGRCSENVPPYAGCDEATGVSRGFACSDATCLRDGGTAGDAPGQFSWPGHINVDPNDQLYVADLRNLRVQRFGADGTFAGEARSEGTGINQGDAPDFVLGNMGPPAAVSVNASSFFVLETSPTLGDFFLHSFSGLPFVPIEVDEGDPADVDRDGFEDNAVLVRYVSRFDFPNALGTDEAVDQFTYRVSDGLAGSAPAAVEVRVARTFRPPEKLALACYAPDDDVKIPCEVDEDAVLDVELEARDPDGVVGFGGLDTLDYEIVEGPRDGQLEFVSADAGLARYRFTPDRDYNGEQTLRYEVSDGVDTVVSEALPITVRPVDDDPVFELTSASATRGFPAQIMLEITDVDADPDERLPDHLIFRFGPVSQAPGELVEQPDGTYAMTGALVMRTTPGRYMVQATPVLPSAGEEIISVSWHYDEDGVHATTRHVTELGSVQVVERSQVGVAVVPASHDPAAGDLVSLDVLVQNAAPEGWPGYAAEGAELTLEFPPELAPEPASAPCATSGQRVVCAFGNLSPGAERNVALAARVRSSGFAPNVKVRGTLRATDPHAPFERMAEAILFPRWVDADGDGLPDEWERIYGLVVGTDDSGADPDADGLDNLREYQEGTNPVVADTDGDGLLDGFEVDTSRTDPLHADTDGDGLPDGWEYDHGLDPLVADAFEDADGDGVNNRIEFERGTDPGARDSDGDGIDDGLELAQRAGFVALESGRTSALFDDAALAGIGLRIESTSPEVIVPGSLGSESVAFPINGRSDPVYGERTTFLFAPDDFARSFGGVIGHAGVVNGRATDQAARAVDVGDLTLRYAPVRSSDERSGFFLESTTGTTGPVFDIGSDFTMVVTTSELDLTGDLLLAPELAMALGRDAEAGRIVGTAEVHAVPEPGALALALAALGALVAVRSRLERNRTSVRGSKEPEQLRSKTIPSSAKKSFPSSSTTMEAGKFSTSMRQTASMPSSSYSSTATFLIDSTARIAAGPPIEPR